MQDGVEYREYDLEGRLDLRLRRDEVPAVSRLYRACHPTWPLRPHEWFMSVNSLVIRDGGPVAWTAFSLSLPPTTDLSQRLGPDAWCAYLIDTCVAESHRGRGLAGLLMDRRLEIAYQAGAQMAIGAAHKGNLPMISILASRGFVKIAEARNQFPDGTTGTVYIKPLGGYDAPHHRR